MNSIYGALLPFARKGTIAFMGMEMPITPAPDAQSLTLSELLRERTAAAHTTAERSGIINDILKQKAGREGYALLLRNLLPAYVALEASLQAREHQDIFGVFATPGLRRTEALRRDLSELAGSEFESTLPLLDAGSRYADRISHAAQGDGIGLLAHAYVRYFGDLSGGQVLKKLLGRSMQLHPEALSFYEFPDIADHRSFKNELRAALDDTADAISDPEDLLGEAVLAFEHNIAVSRAVQDAIAGPNSEEN